MTVRTILRYLAGDRDAILAVAASRWSPLVGILFVISAGLAREYDGEDLVHEPWHVLRPLAASFVSGTTLFLVVVLFYWWCHRPGGVERPRFWRSYVSFMGLFWMTAPMAWVYAIPYERWFEPVDAVLVNLWTLALVSIWRVALMVRVVSVVSGLSPARVFFTVMLFADAVALAVIIIIPKPVINVMGGVRTDERDALIASTAFTIFALGTVTLPVWIIGAFWSNASAIVTWPGFRQATDRVWPRGAVCGALVSIGLFVPLLFWAQPEQINRREAETLLYAGSIGDAFASMSSKSRGDFPPHWNPPPRIGYRERVPDLNLVLAHMETTWPAEWVADLYVPKFARRAQSIVSPFSNDLSWVECVELVPQRLRATDPRHEEDRRRLRDISGLLLDALGGLSETDRAALRILAGAAEPGDFDVLSGRARADWLQDALAYGDDAGIGVILAGRPQMTRHDLGSDWDEAVAFVRRQAEEDGRTEIAERLDEHIRAQQRRRDASDAGPES